MVQLMDFFTNLWDMTIVFSPKLVGAVILLVIGLVLGKVIGRVVKELLDKTKLDYYVTETTKPVVSLTHLFAVIVRWWIYIGFVGAAVEVLGITVLQVWFVKILNFIPNIIGATAIMVAGYVLAEYIKDQMKKTGKIYASIVSKILFFFIIYVSIAISLPILGIPATLVSNILLIIIGSVGLGIAIALGLGMKEAVAEISKKYAKKVRI